MDDVFRINKQGISGYIRQMCIKSGCVVVMDFSKNEGFSKSIKYS